MTSIALGKNQFEVVSHRRSRSVDGGQLAPLQKLTMLSLKNCNSLGDAGLEHLQTLTNLKLLGLRDTQVTAAGVAKLQQALPNCKVEWDGVKSVTGDVPTSSAVTSHH